MERGGGSPSYPSSFHEEIKRNQLIEAKYEQFVFPTDVYLFIYRDNSVAAVACVQSRLFCE